LIEEVTMRSLTDKIAVVTGAASGIGQATAIEFADKGADVVVSDVNEPGLVETVSAIEAKGRRAVALGVDVSKPEQVEGMINKAIETFGKIDVLMNNAGVGLSGEMRHLSLKDWEWIMGINLWGPIYGIHFALPHMVKQRSGHIVNVASSAGLIASSCMSAYTTTKFGVVGLSEVLRNELVRFGIGVTVVCPGFVRTNIFDATEARGMKDVPGGDDLPSWLGISKEACAKNILKAVQRNKFLIIPGPEMKVVYSFKRFAPFLYRGVTKMIGKQFERMSVD
jgi:NAD(P)-dependent dehydrogenase (short-subunit alcohol dehydrogenase family)